MLVRFGNEAIPVAARALTLQCIASHTGGYLNEHGILNVQRLQLVLDELTIFEKEHFEYEFADSNWFKGKQNKPNGAMEKAKARGKLGKCCG